MDSTIDNNQASQSEVPVPQDSKTVVCDDNPAIKSLVRSNTRMYEQYLLTAVWLSREFWNIYCRGRVNINISKFKTFTDFSTSVMNDIYECICTFYESINPKDNLSVSTDIIDDKTTFAIGGSVDRGFILGLLKDKMYQGKLSVEDVKFAESLISDMEKLIRDSTIKKVDETSGKEIEEISTIFLFAKQGFSYWLNLRRVTQVAANLYNSKVTADEMIEKLKSATSDVTAEEGSDIMSFEDAVEFEDVDNGGFRMPIATLPIMTRVLAGGLKKGETGLVASLPSGGKTIMACQMATGLALNGFTTLVISTEQHAVNLAPRCISLSTNIPFELIADGIKHAIKTNRLTEQHKTEIKEFTNLVKPYLFFENWGLKGTKLTTGLVGAIDNFIKLHGNLDVVIIDWIGGGIEKPPEEKSKKSEYYDYTMKYICKIMKQKHLAGVVMAQINPKQAENVSMITINEVSECKTLDQDVSWALGISRLEVSKTRISNQIQASYRSQQTFNFWKNRLSPPYHYPVIREFQYQRFAEREQASPMMNIPAKVELQNIDQLNIASNAMQ